VRRRRLEQVTAELAFERSGPERVYSSIVLLEEWLSVLRRRSTAGEETNDALLGQFAAHLCVLREMSISVTSRLEQGHSPIIEAALVKDLGTQFEQALPPSSSTQSRRCPTKRSRHRCPARWPISHRLLPRSRCAAEHAKSCVE